MGQDPIDAASAALQTAIGSNETELRARLGNEGYEAYMKRFNALEDLRIIDSGHHAEQTKAWTGVTNAKAAFWRSLGFVMVLGAFVGTGWSIWTWFR